MPQEAWVLKCYSCNKFQVQLKKKTKKWQCKVCGSKQDVINIYFKGSTSDCRINVQNMNAAEGEKIDREREECDSQDEDYTNDNIENLSHNLQNSHNHSFSCEDMEEFTNSVLEADISEPCVKSDEDYFQESSAVFSAELVEHNVKTNEYDFDIKSFDFTIKTYKEFATSSPRNKNQPALPSIFESNREFDESLDF